MGLEKPVFHSSIHLFAFSPLSIIQGEDGFPGFKGDMGIKGDRVRVYGRCDLVVLSFQACIIVQTQLRESSQVGSCQGPMARPMSRQERRNLLFTSSTAAVNP